MSNRISKFRLTFYFTLHLQGTKCGWVAAQGITGMSLGGALLPWGRLHGGLDCLLHACFRDSSVCPPPSVLVTPCCRG